jgi:hypothetical protein
LTRIIWDDAGSRFFEAGVDRGVLYVDTNPGVPWNGLTGVNENSTGGVAQPFYVDGQKYSNTATREDYSATLTAFTYPDEFTPCEGTSSIRPGLLITKQQRKGFGLTYRTMVGNDVSPSAGYKIHLLYNAFAAPSARSHKSISATTTPDDFSWAITTLPVSVAGYRASPHFVIDSREIDPQTLSGIEDILYGNDTTSARLPTLTELIDLIDSGDALTVTDNGDGTFSMTAPMTDLSMLDSEIFQLTWPTAIDNGDGTITVSSS